MCWHTKQLFMLVIHNFKKWNIQKINIAWNVQNAPNGMYVCAPVPEIATFVRIYFCSRRWKGNNNRNSTKDIVHFRGVEKAPLVCWKTPAVSCVCAPRSSKSRQSGSPENSVIYVLNSIREWWLTIGFWLFDCEVIIDWLMWKT